MDAQVIRHRRTDEERHRRHLFGDRGARFSSKLNTIADDGISNTLTSFTKDNQIVEYTEVEIIEDNSILEMKKRYRIRKLTPRECYRLMGVRDTDIDKMMAVDENGKRLISDSKCYQLAGNSIVVDTMVNGIFKYLFLETEKPEDTLF